MVELSRIEKRKLEFRDKIIDSALVLFEQQGVAETSIASIIKEADIAHKTFFNHFPSKEHLLVHIVDVFSANAYQSFKEGFKRKKDPAKRLEYCFMSIAKILDGVNSSYKELLNVYLINGAGSGILQQKQKEQFTAVIEQIMNDAKADKRLNKDLTVQAYTEIAVGLCVSVLLSWSIEENYPIVDKMKITTQFLNKSIFI